LVYTWTIPALAALAVGLSLHSRVSGWFIHGPYRHWLSSIELNRVLTRNNNVVKSAASPRLGLQVPLYAEFHPGELMHFLQHSLGYDLNEALAECTSQGMTREQVYLLGRMVGLHKLNPVIAHSLKGAWLQPLNLSSDFLVSNFAFKRVNLYRYSMGGSRRALEIIVDDLGGAVQVVESS
jgi:hypothetical protein